MMSRKYLAHLWIPVAVSLILSACGGGGGSGQGKTSPAPESEYPTSHTAPSPANPSAPAQPQTPAPVLAKVTVAGRITYDRVPFEGRSFRGLDYTQTQVLPVRGATVQLVDSGNRVIYTGQTDGQGYYSFAVEANRQLRMRVLAELRGTGSAAWDIQVRDNTNRDALYALEGSLVSAGSGDSQTRDLHAPSGWTGEAYTEARSAAPFAILDSIYDAVQTVVDADPTVVMPPLVVYWSPANIAIGGNYNQGYIGTSFYTSAGPAIYLLGQADNDADEYDRGVVQHEFGHYLEHQLGRTESIGGSHSQSTRLDMRVAFGEAWGNAFAGMVSGDPIYRDSFGSKQSLGFTINVETRNFGNQGWHNEAAIQSFLYDLFDDEQDPTDHLALGFRPLYEVLTSSRYREFDGFASVYAFAAELELQHPEEAPQISDMLTSVGIHGRGWYGEGETNDAGSPVTLPVYHQLQLGQTVNVCSDTKIQDYNGVDVRRYIRVSFPETRIYTLSATRNGGGILHANPQMKLFRQGNLVAQFTSGFADFESGQRLLTQGEYVIEIYEQTNADGSLQNGGLACFDVRIQ